MFGRTKTPQPEPSTTSQPAKAGGKGRPTPTRREAEARNRRPMVGATAVRPGATKEEQKAARAERRAAAAADRAKAREAMVTGDDRYLPTRDKGPVRRYVRDVVDARTNIGEYLLPGAVVILVLGMIRVPSVRAASALLLYGLVLAVVVDTVLLRRKVTRLTRAKFGDKAVGIGGYAMMRALQLRRTRMPRPQVKRGQYPT